MRASVTAAPAASNTAAPADVAVRDLAIPAADSTELAATLFEPGITGAAGAPLVVIGAATAVKRSYYMRFATYLAELGHPVLTFDYRGIGGSRHGSLVGSHVRMRDWCILDVPGALTWARRTYPERPIHWVGHSMGGFATGLAHNNHLVARQLNVATLSGYWGRMAAPERYRVRLLMRYLAPLVIRAKGYFPGVLMGGEDLPGPAFLEWMHWCTEPEFLFSDDTLPERRNYPRFRAPIRFAQDSDDPWGTPAAVGHMAEHFTASVDRSIWQVTPADAGVQKIGHFGFFRPDLRDTLWNAAAEWLLRPAGG
jgi:predicted alpha/beta hydrolase